MIRVALALALLLSSCGGAPDNDRDRCIGSGGTKFIYDARTGSGQCVYEEAP